jgi:hypothetical protein
MKPPLAVTLYQSRRGGISLAGTPVWREGLRSESNDSEAMNQGSNLLTKKKIAESNSSFSEVISSVLPDSDTLPTPSLRRGVLFRFFP